MNWREISIVFRKELLDILRDRRTILAMIVVPLLVYPVMIIVISQVGLSQVEKLRTSKARLAVLPDDASPEFLAALEADTSFVLVETATPETDLLDRSIDAVIRIPFDFDQRMANMDSARVSVRVDLSRDRGEQMRSRLERFLSDWRREKVQERLTAENLPAAFVQPFEIEVDNAAGDRKMGGSLVGRILPFFLVMMMMTGAFYPAIDVTAGERERGTLETLLVAPASRFNVVMGKFFTVFVASIVTTLSNMASIAFTFFFLIGSANLGGAITANLAGLLDWRAFFLIFVIMVPMAILFSSLAMMVASFARSFKEAQNYLSPLMIVCLAPAYLSFLPGVEINTAWALVPIANVVLLSRELLLGNYVWPIFVITMATMSALALLFLHRTVTIFGSEAMLGGDDARGKFSWKNLFQRVGTRSQTLDTGLVGQVFLLVLLGFFYVGTPLQMWELKLGLVITQLAVIAGIPMLALRLRGIPVGRTLGLSRLPKPGVWPLVLIGFPAATMAAALVGMAQGMFMEMPDSYREMMEQLFETKGQAGLLTSLVVFALVPALCEEILFRGFVLRGLARRLPPLQAVLWTALLFGVFHFDMYRLLPTTMLGVALGLLVWATGSLWPAILLHALNNGFAVLANNVEWFQNIPWLQEGASIPVSVLATIAVLGAASVYGLSKLRREAGLNDQTLIPVAAPPEAREHPAA